ncbi:methyltransferase domain-containing protein [Streptomyces sp. IB2014 016-6]|uniref:methyltransferase domain-containing protein n=1 Tax=Streptomyces sp. IB2014 016-6 TaxID=2517818 RepID=UPI0011CA8BEB|nr:methyltransferase domain-containing protein [Streptomyces sp. IB2014 016-6]TXL88908.1 methyltransferase domain-containing protein [Streptomyces sp. IB2014 016-6]
MHRSAYEQMELCVKEYMPASGRHRVVDLGSRISPKQSLTHRSLLDGRDVDYIGVDVLDGPNVDIVMRRPYRIPVRSRTADFVISGQAFEHIPFFWASMMEIARVLRPGGLAFVTAPSRGHVHDAQDCWRYYPDGFRAMAAFSGLELAEGYTDFPPMKGIRFDYAAIDGKRAYWGDSVGVFRRPRRPRRRLWEYTVRELTVRYANRVGGVDSIPLPEPVAGRDRCGRGAPVVPAPAPEAQPGAVQPVTVESNTKEA